MIVVTYCSGDVICDCLDSLMASRGVELRIVIVDNASGDDTVARIVDWAKRNATTFSDFSADDCESLSFEQLAPVTLLRVSTNLGFAGGVNVGLRALRVHDQIELFWLLNPDCVVATDTAHAYRQEAQRCGPFSLMGGRTIYIDAPNVIQSDGGRVDRWLGRCSNVNQGLMPRDAPLPKATSLDYISGANVVASRAFVDQAGLLNEDYFLYYEEVDWAARRKNLPLVVCSQAVVHHHGGTSLGSGSMTRRSSGFANYFNYRNRMRYLRKFHVAGLPIAYAYSILKIVKLCLLGAWDEANGAFRGLHQLPPPLSVRSRISPEAAKKAFGAETSS